MWSLWEALVKPHEAVTSLDGRRHARALASILVILIPLLIVPAAIRGAITGRFHFYPFLLGFLLMVGYALSRTRRYRLGIVLTMAALTINPLIGALASDHSPAQLFMALVWAVPTIVMGHLLLPLRRLIILAVTNLAGMLLLPLVQPEITYPALLYPVGFNLISYVMIIVSSAIRAVDVRQLRQLSRAAEQSANSIVITDLEGRIEYVNPKFTKLTGYTFEEVKGKNPRILKSGKTPPEEYRRLWKTISSGGEWSGEFINRKKNGELYYELATIAPIRDEEGRITHYIAVKEDITARKLTEERLRVTNERLQTLMRVDKEISRKLDVKYVLTIALDAAVRMSGADAGLIGLNEGEAVRIVHIVGKYPPEMVDALLQEDNSITARSVVRREAVLVRDVASDPDYKSVIPETQAQITIPLISQKRLVGVMTLETSDPARFTDDVFEFLKMLGEHVAIAIDNSLMYEEKLRLVRDLDAFAHTVAHDLKNPLSVIGGYADTLDMLFDTMSDEAKRDYLRKIVDAVSQLNDIIEALLLLASVRKTDVKLSRLDMGLILANVHVRLTNLINEYDARIISPDSWPAALGYGPWIEEVWANYISNAIKYGGDSPLVELGSDLLQDDGMVRFWVRDRGHGISTEDQKVLFDDFVRLEGAKEKPGHGLGLSIVKRIVEKMGGQVGVESVEGKGSLFWFTLPAADG